MRFVPENLKVESSRLMELPRFCASFVLRVNSSSPFLTDWPRVLVADRRYPLALAFTKCFRRKEDVAFSCIISTIGSWPMRVTVTGVLTSCGAGSACVGELPHPAPVIMSERARKQYIRWCIILGNYLYQ